VEALDDGRGVDVVAAAKDTHQVRVHLSQM
jgi:hypothetical protein